MAVVRVTSAGGLRMNITTGSGHTLVSDEPVDKGGEDAGPSPYELLLASLGS
jgi:putative redox protein